MTKSTRCYGIETPGGTGFCIEHLPTRKSACLVVTTPDGIGHVVAYFRSEELMDLFAQCLRAQLDGMKYQWTHPDEEAGHE